MPNLSHVTVVGHLGRDAETKQTNSGHSVTEFSLAVTPKKGAETMWFRCAMWGKRGEAVAQYLEKGKPVLVIGAFTVREYEGKNGAGYSLEVHVDELQLLGGGGGEQQQEQEQAPANDGGGW